MAILRRFVFHSPAPRVLFGRGTVDAVALELDLHRISHAFVLCTGSGMELSQRIAASAPDRGIEVLRLAHPGISQEDFERAMAHAAKIQSDGFIVVGGGTPIGLAKAIAAHTQLRYVAVVTTYSGSEMSSSWNYGKGEQARSGASLAALPSTAIYDPDLTLGIWLARGEETIAVAARVTLGQIERHRLLVEDDVATEQAGVFADVCGEAIRAAARIWGGHLAQASEEILSLLGASEIAARRPGWDDLLISLAGCSAALEPVANGLREGDLPMDGEASHDGLVVQSLTGVARRAFEPVFLLCG